MNNKKYIVVANVGNRSLIWNDETQEDNSQLAIGVSKHKLSSGDIIEKKDFRELTKDFLENIETFAINLEVNILNVLLDKLVNDHKKIDAVYLFTSNQEGLNNGFVSQDTIHAGEVMKHLIEAKYQIETKPKVIVASVVNADKLIPEYQKEILNLRKEHENTTFIFCDSGGTPQQKTALKITVEYLLTEYEYYRIQEEKDEDGQTLLGKGGSVEPLKTREYRTIIDNQHILNLFQKGNCKAALTIFESDDTRQQNGKLHKFLQIYHYRKELLFKNAIDDIAGGQKRTLKSTFPSLKKFLDRNPLGNYDIQWGNELIKEHFFKLCEILAVAQDYYHLKDFTQFILLCNIFVERFIAAVISQEHWDEDTNTGYSLFDNDDFDFLKNLFNNLKNTGTLVKNSPALWNQFKYAKILALTNSQDILDLFAKCHESFGAVDGIYKFRNKTAHEGKGIKDEQEIDDKFINTPNVNSFKEDIFDKWLDKFGMLPTKGASISKKKYIELQKKENIYYKAYKELEKVLKGY